MPWLQASRARYSARRWQTNAQIPFNQVNFTSVRHIFKFLKAPHISRDVVRAENIASISRKIRMLAWWLWVDLTGHGLQHWDHSIKSTWYCGLKSMNSNASSSWVLSCYVSRNIVRLVIDARFRDFWPSDILRVCNTCPGPELWPAVCQVPITWELRRFCEFDSERFRVFMFRFVVYSKFPRLALGKRCDRCPVRQWGSATRAGSGCGNTWTLEYSMWQDNLLN